MASMSTVAASVDDVIEQALRAARLVTGLDLAYVSSFADGAQRVEATSGDGAEVGIAAGDVVDLESSYCQRMIDGRIPNAVPDTSREPELTALSATHDANIRAYVGVPIRLRDGALYGSLCAAAGAARPHISDDQVAAMRGLAQLLADRLEETLEHGSRQRAQDEFFAAVSHDLRGPLTPIRGYAELLREDGSDPERVRLAADAIARNATKLDRLIDDLLSVARARSGGFTVHREPLDLRALLSDAVAETAQTSGRDAVLDAPAATLAVDGDDGRLRQLFDNLLSNAVKYSPDGGEIRVTASVDGPTVVVEVADPGIGVGEEDQARLFGQYVRAQTAVARGIPGTGLGLTICRAIAAAHDGTIGLASQPGEGTTVTVRLPLHGDG